MNCCFDHKTVFFYLEGQTPIIFYSIPNQATTSWVVGIIIPLPHERIKLLEKLANCVFLGCGDNHKRFLYCDPSIRKNRISQNVVFLE